MAASTSKAGSEFEQIRANLQKSVLESTNLARQIPGPNDLRFQRTLSRPLGKKVDQASKRLLHITSRVLDLAKQAQSKNDDKGKQVDRGRVSDLQEEDVVDAYQTRIVQVTDHLLEQIDANLDEAFQAAKKSKAQQAEQPVASTSRAVSPEATISRNFRNAGDIRKPQLDFNEVYDTSRDAVFKPLLPYKPHALEPLDVSTSTQQVSENGSTSKAAVNPYAKEIQAALRKPFPKLENPYEAETLERMSSAMDNKPYLFVDTPEKLVECLTVLKDAKVIAIDLEHHDLHSYRGVTCLIQVSTVSHDFIIDPLVPEVRSNLHTLNEAFANPEIVKVLHGAEFDIIWLQRDFGLYIVNLFDTYHASRALNRLTGHSLASLLKEYTTFLPEKKYQLADWRIRPLTAELINYARSDTHFLIYIFFAILGNPAMTPEVLQSIRASSATTASQVYEHTGYDFETGEGPGGWKRMADRSGKLEIWGVDEYGRSRSRSRSRSPSPSTGAAEPWKWSDKQGRAKFEVFRALHEWRDRIAREEDESVGYILSNKNLMSIAERVPDNMRELVYCVGSDMKGGMGKRSQKILEVVAAAKQKAIEYQKARTKERRASPGPNATLSSLWNSSTTTNGQAPLQPKPASAFAKLFQNRTFTSTTSSFFGEQTSQTASNSGSTSFSSAVQKVHQALLEQLQPASAAVLGGSSRAAEIMPVKTEPEEVKPPKAEKVEDRNEILHINSRKKDKGKKRKSPEGEIAAEAALASTSSAPAPAKKADKPAYVKPFDYTGVKSVLDEPMPELQARKRPKKVRGGDQEGATTTAAEGPTFKRPPKSMNQPKHGNKSHTFV